MIKKVNVAGEYEVIIGRDILASAGKIIRNIEKGLRCVVVSDDRVAPIYSEKVLNALSAEGFDASLFVFEHGEKSKHIGTVTQMLNFFADRRLARTDFVVALGGGVVGDMAGFAASIYLRGISFVQIPTTLLSQIDSSVGGKTGCDLPSGKNLVGAFHKPSVVIADINTLDTLPDKFMRDGMGEMIKYGAIRSEKLFKQLENEGLFENLEDKIYECVKIKAEIVEKDFHDNGQRALLNFGHTIGHAIEKLENFCGMSHGCAVAVGMCIITRAAEKVELCHNGNAGRIEALCKKYGLETEYSCSAEEIAEAAMLDKKRMGSQVKLVLIRKIGDSYLCPISCNKLSELLEGCVRGEE